MSAIKEPRKKAAKRMYNYKSVRARIPGKYYDHKIPGLYMWIGEGGKKTWYLYYRRKTDNRDVRFKVCDGEALSVENAREIAMRHYLTVQSGGDPRQNIMDFRESPTVKELAELWMDDNRKRLKAPQFYDNYLRIYILPWFGEEKVNEVRRSKFHKKIMTLHRQPATANRIISTMSALFNFAERYGLRVEGNNPAKHIRKFKEKPRRRYVRPEEATKMAAYLLDKHDEYPNSVAFILLLWLTGARCGEVEAARWEHVKGSRIVLPDSKTGVERTLILTHEVIAWLKTLPVTRDGYIVGIKSPKKFWGTMMQALEIEDLRMHDLRHAYASAGLSAGLSMPQIGGLLGHTNAQTTQRYAHLVDDTAYHAAEQTQNEIEAMTNGLFAELTKRSLERSDQSSQK